MVYSGTVCWLRSTARITIGAIAAFTLLQPLQVQAQQPSGQGSQQQVEPADDPTDPNNLPPSDARQQPAECPGRSAFDDRSQQCYFQIRITHSLLKSSKNPAKFSINCPTFTNNWGAVLPELTSAWPKATAPKL